MRYKIYIFLLAVVVIALPVLIWCEADLLWIGMASLMAVVLLIMIYKAVNKPLEAVQNGIYLLKSQDFSSKLCTTGQPDADKVVDLFNGMMEAMKAERLKSHEQERFLAKLIAASPTGIAVCGFNGDITVSNRAWHELVNDSVMATLQRLKPGETETLRLPEARILRCSRLWFMDSGFRRTFYLVERITDEIVQAEKQLFNKTVRTIGHEVNNTMGSVMSVLETMMEFNDSDPVVSATLEGCHSSCDNLVKFVRAYSDIVKLPSPSPSHIDVGEWLQDMIPVWSLSMPDNVGLCYLRTSDTRLLAYVDSMLMERVIVNIIKNSVESIGSRADGKIEISIDRDSIYITDNGRGIVPEDMPRLFTPFFSTKCPDRGLGLMLVADILRGHKASFSLSTDRKTGLTTFRITFNRAKTQF